MLGDIAADGAPSEEFGFLLATPNASAPTPALLSYVEKLHGELQSIPGYQTFGDRLISACRLVPFLHLERGRIVQYTQDDAYAPDATRIDDDEWFGSGLETSFAVGGVDDAWVCREHFAEFQEEGHFGHIPFLRETEDSEE